MNKTQIKKLKAVLRSMELNAMVFSEVQQSLESEQHILEERQTNYEWKGTDYWEDRALDLDERIDNVTEEAEALQEIEDKFSDLISEMRVALSRIETERYKAEMPRPSKSEDMSDMLKQSKRDAMFDQCARFIVTQSTASTSMLQRRFGIGYNKACKIMEQLEEAGIVGPAYGAKPRAILVDGITVEEIIANYRV